MGERDTVSLKVLEWSRRFVIVVFVVLLLNSSAFSVIHLVESPHRALVPYILFVDTRDFLVCRSCVSFCVVTCLSLVKLLYAPVIWLISFCCVTPAESNTKFILTACHILYRCVVDVLYSFGFFYDVMCPILLNKLNNGLNTQL